MYDDTDTDAQRAASNDADTEHRQLTNDAEAREATQRARYLSRVHPDLREDVALAVAYRELGYTHSGITQLPGIDVSESTVAGWLDDVAERYGVQAVETKWEEQRQRPLGSPRSAAETPR